MTAGSTTWALVVGIDEYDEPAVPRLKGAAADAIAVVKWLRLLGVPDKQILLHSAPSATTRPKLQALNIPFLDAREPTIWGSVKRLLDVPDGTRLFVFLSGHGLWEPMTGRLFLTQEAGVNGVHPNLGIDLYINCFLSSVFPRQFLIMDGCLNLPYEQDVRQTIAAHIYSNVPYTQRGGNWLVAAFGASFDERAYEIKGRGAFLRRLLPAMNPNNPDRAGIHLDFTNGVRSLDMQKVMNPGVIESVHADAMALRPSKKQTPQTTIHGRLSAGDPSPVFEIQPTKTVQVRLSVDPTAAASDVESVRLWVDDPWASELRPKYSGGNIAWPLGFAIPANVPAKAKCQIRRNAPWDVETFVLDFTGAADQSQVFRLSPRKPGGGGRGGGGGGGPEGGGPLPGAGPAPRGGVGGGLALGGGPVPGSEGPTGDQTTDDAFARVGEPALLTAPYEQYSVTVVDPNGFPRGEVLNQYPALQAALGVTVHEPAIEMSGSKRLQPDHGPNSPWLPIERGIEMQRHETGPHFRVQVESLLRGRKVAADWAQAIVEILPSDLGVLTVLNGDAAPEQAPNLRFKMPPGGAATIAGRLATLPAVRIGPPAIPSTPIWRTKDGRSLAELESAKSFRVDPGPNEIRVDLPWGSWAKVVSVPDIGPARTVTLPRQIGSPPLRVALRNQPSPSGYVVYGASGRKLSGRVVRSNGDAHAQLERIPPGAAKWGLRAPIRTNWAAGEAVVRLEGNSTAWFPILREWAIAVDWTPRGLRVEPLSDLVSPEWDLLVGTGQLDAITSEDAIRLTQAKWFDAILGLAGAYAVYVAAKWDYLAEVARNLRSVTPTGVDVDLVSIAAQRGVIGKLSAESRDRLSTLAIGRPVPVLRWGVALARDLLADSGLKTSDWDRDLARIQHTLSPLSVWTAWTER